MLTLPVLRQCRSVPTEDQILVPETLLKKRKSQEKQREERAAEVEKKKKVSVSKACTVVLEQLYGHGDDIYQSRD